MSGIEFLSRWKSCTDLGVGEYDEDSPEAWAISVGSSLSRGRLVDHSLVPPTKTRILGFIEVDPLVPKWA